MSSTLKEQRLRLFNRGNGRCPICLAQFTEPDVDEGKRVTLEHVPPRSFGGASIAMCLTCADCNSAAGRVEHGAAEVQRGKVQIRPEGLPKHTAYMTDLNVSERRATLRMSRLRTGISERDFSKALLSGNPVQISWKHPKPHLASVPLLKAAYLSVFSLLGVDGYEYAEDEALADVRRQIRTPRAVIIPKFSTRTPTAWPSGYDIILSRELPCWAVRVGERVVMLPTEGDDSLYDRLQELPEFTLRRCKGSPAVKFGQDP